MAKTRRNEEAMLRMAAQHIGERIVPMRGERVLLDTDLTALYGVTTGALNRAVKRNLERFPKDFMFQLTPVQMIFAALRQLEETTSWAYAEGRRLIGFHARPESNSSTEEDGC